MRRIGLALVLSSMALSDGVPLRAQQDGRPVVTVYKDANCGCCAKWAEHLRQHGFQANTVDTADMADVKTKNNVPRSTRSCHTALVNGYVIEGHVPAADVHRLLKERPAGVVGIAVPGMPIGSPGMEMPGGKVDAFEVMAFDKQGRTTLFASHGR